MILRHFLKKVYKIIEKHYVYKHPVIPIRYVPKPL